MNPPRTQLSQLDACDETTFVSVVGPCFERSPWIAHRTWRHRPFASIKALHRSLCDTVRRAPMDEQLSLIMAHPDLVGHATAVTLTPDSQQEQTAAGLGNLTPREIAEFQRLNAEYRERFGFPFIICARENRKAAILAAFPVRLTHSRDTEVSAALAEIDKIAWLRLLDRVRGPVE